MKRTLDHLPLHKRDMITRIAELIRDSAMVEVIILYGSYARGDWVEDPANGYMSDVDILVLVSSPDLAADDELWIDCQDQARSTSGDTLVSIIAHTIEDVRQKLALANSFFRDVLTEGIALCDAGRIELPTVTALTMAQRHALADFACAHYFKRAAQLFEYFEHSTADRWHGIATFTLHQTAETLYKAIIMVFDGYLPKTHDLAALDAMSTRVAPDIGSLIPRTVPDRKRLARLIRSGYLDARYNMAFTIARADLDTLGRFVRDMHERAERACRERLDLLGGELTADDLHALATGGEVSIEADGQPEAQALTAHRSHVRR